MSEAREQLKCANGCTRVDVDGNHEPLIPIAPAIICDQCVRRLERWLIDIPDRYALLPGYLLPSADLDKNPETKTTRNPHAPTPLRVNVLDLLDERHGRQWQGIAPTRDRRGTLGVLHAWAEEIRAERNTDTRLKANVSREAATIARHLPWAIQQRWVTDMYSELRTLHRDLGNATGQYPPKPVGHCTAIDLERDTKECGGPLLPSVGGGVFCPRCNTHWNETELRRLGLVLDQETEWTA